MTIKQQGGIFGRNPTFNQVTSSTTIIEQDQTPVLRLNGSGKNQNVEPFGSIEFYNGDTSGPGPTVSAAIKAMPVLTSGSGGEVAFFGLHGTEAEGTAPPELARFTWDGNLKLAINGGGIDFSATSGTGTSELFDDYEEGTWTPVAQDSSGNSGTAATASGYYTKVGNLVYLNFLLQDINTTGLSSGQDLRIAGLPFASASIVGSQFYLGSVRVDNVTFSGNLSLGILDSTDYIRVVETASGAAGDFIVVSEVTSGTGDIYGTIVYMAS